VFQVANKKSKKKRSFMNAIRTNTLLTLALVAAFAAMTLGAAPAAASSVRHGNFHVTKDCSAYTGTAGSFCTISASNLPEITVGSKVFYFQPIVASTGLLDSNIVLDAGGGNRAVGHCTLDLATSRALCTFSDGTGAFWGFHARVKGSGDFANYHWHGSYSFKR
jgi:hypothetical protein